MSILFNRNDTAAKLTAEVDRLQKRKAILAAKLDAARKAETAARDSHKRYFVDGDESDISTAARLAAAVTAAVADVAAIADALETVDGLIEEGRAAIVAAREAGERQKRAAEISKRIERLEPLAATAERQLEGLIGTLEKIAESAADPALDVRQYHELRGHGDRLPATALVAASLSEAIFNTAPDLLTVTKTPAGMFARAVLPVMTRRHGGLSVDLPIDAPDAEASFLALPLSGALTQNVIDPLRAAAAEILDGTRPIAKASTVIDDDDGEDTEPTFDWKWLVFIKPTTWRDWKGETVTQADSRAMVPDPVARAALAAGVAVPENSPEAQTHENWRYEKGFNHSAVAMGKDVVTLDVRWPAPERAAA